MKKIIALFLALTMLLSLCACAQNAEQAQETTQATENTQINETETDYDVDYIEKTLNLANNEDQEWTYSAGADAWVLSVVSAVAYPELPDQQGVSVCVPGAYVTGIDTSGDGVADVTSADANEAVRGSLVIDYEAQITSTNGQVYTATTAPVIINTGAAGYGSQNNSAASTSHAADGYINVSCGNRGKQDTATDENGNAVDDLTDFDKASAFIQGRYTKSSSGGMMGGMPGGMGDLPGDLGDLPDGELPDGMNGGPGGGKPDGGPDGDLPDGDLPGDMTGGPGGDIVGTPDAGTTQSATGNGVDSSSYASYEEMVEAYRTDIEAIYAGDEYGNNIVALYNPLNYIGAEGTENPTWTKIIMGASEGDISMFNSLNLQIAWLSAGVDAQIEWQWNGGHVPSEVLGDSFSLYVDQMYGEYVDGAATISKNTETVQTNGTAEEATGTDISSWISLDDASAVSFTLADAAAYRTAGASKAMPAFDVIDYGQEDYVFGDSDTDARHWNLHLLKIFDTYADVLAPLFNAGN